MRCEFKEYTLNGQNNECLFNILCSHFIKTHAKSTEIVISIEYLFFLKISTMQTLDFIDRKFFRPAKLVLRYNPRLKNTQHNRGARASNGALPRCVLFCIFILRVAAAPKAGVSPENFNQNSVSVYPNPFTQ